MSGLEVAGVSQRYGSVDVLHDVTFEVRKGEFVTVLGQSGSGKTTLLRAIAGFITPSAGTIRLGDQDVSQVPLNKRDVGMVFQNYALFPHMSVRENVGYGLKIRRVAKDEIAERVDTELRRVAMLDFADRRPSQLSGGQQQRVALARALVLRPQVVLFDEPFSSLDAMLRVTLRADLRELQRSLGFTAMFVTHDHVEAMSMADRVAVMHQGRLLQIDDPATVYRRPTHRATAQLLGRSNLLPCTPRVENGTVTVDWMGKTLRTAVARDTVPDQAYAMIRPENVTVAPGGPSSDGNDFTGAVINQEYQGGFCLLTVRDDAGRELLCAAPSEAPVLSAGVGAVVTVAIPPSNIWLVDD